MTTDVERRIAGSFDSRFLRSYTRSKLSTDPVYRAVLERLRESTAPLYDIGCGVGLLEFYLRENGVECPITGIDHDERKIATANAIGANYIDVHFRIGDARDPVPPRSNVVLVDLLHYFTTVEQQQILGRVADADGDLVLIRDAIRDGTLRYRITAAQERFSRAIRWLRAERLNFQTREEVIDPFRARGYRVEVEPMWGRTPFNNYLFVFRRSGVGTTKR
ncbi:MAG TPA: class I SAM-dependent methyltransferase [Thermoanaerobaculia bacterium]|nr:class I SAM-dependent methyltransferase [Thermoanaerobaculia bacterium]